MRLDGTKMKRVLHWFQHDLRVTDNTALHHACGEKDDPTGRLAPEYPLPMVDHAREREGIG